jgi:hypothetical protein
MREGVDDRLRETDPFREHGADLAVRGERTFRAFRIGEAPRDQPDAPRPGLAGGDATHELPHHLPP